METTLSDRELACYLRDALGSAEDVEWATQIPSDLVHLVAQNRGLLSSVQSKALRALYHCCMFAPLSEGETIHIWLARPNERTFVAPVSLIWAGREQELRKLLLLLVA